MQIQAFVSLLLTLAAIGAGAFAVVHAVRQRPDAFPAVDKLTKPVWLAILGVSTFVLFVFNLPSLLGFVAVIAIGVYLADVRPRVDEVQRGPRW
ncbi:MULTISPECIES: DUF2516 family protein [Hoyosella]|uniref:Transmembrane protein n=2 Tax=Hoyosella TaxID=697025 RepID=F6EJL6_HOYSD|nr:MULTISPECIES: DUF2516 family protein [Hoyosella]AEF39065.1 Transmembrane protein [Hoyosella subflava DQS3-9A1]MBB3037509.1 hypothetical protein [Hoyosella altamirensis]